MLLLCRQQAVAPVAKVFKLASHDHVCGSGLDYFEEDEEGLSSVCCTAYAWMTDGLGTKLTRAGAILLHDMR